MKSLIKNESAVAYLLLVGLGLTIVIVGIAFGFIMDFVDYTLAAINGFEGTPMADQMDEDSIEGGHFLYTLLKFILIPGLLVLVYWIWQLAQKPVKPW